MAQARELTLNEVITNTAKASFTAEKSQPILNQLQRALNRNPQLGIEAKDAHGMTPLMHILKTAHYLAYNFILHFRKKNQLRLDVNARDRNGMTALMHLIDYQDMGEEDAPDSFIFYKRMLIKRLRKAIVFPLDEKTAHIMVKAKNYYFLNTILEFMADFEEEPEEKDYVKIPEPSDMTTLQHILEAAAQLGDICTINVLFNYLYQHFPLNLSTLDHLKYFINCLDVSNAILTAITHGHVNAAKHLMRIGFPSLSHRDTTLVGILELYKLKKLTDDEIDTLVRAWISHKLPIADEDIEFARPLKNLSLTFLLMIQFQRARFQPRSGLGENGLFAPMAIEDAPPKSPETKRDCPSPVSL